MEKTNTIVIPGLTRDDGFSGEGRPDRGMVAGFFHGAGFAVDGAGFQTVGQGRGEQEMVDPDAVVFGP